MDSKIGSEYNGFVVVGNYHFKEDQAEGLYLRHKESGLEVFHILDGSKENGFAFAFRTVAKNSKGTAHILEHSVLCGSEKYPLKEPFTTLNNQGVLTFSNAFTYPEKTVYPASSVVKKDYFTSFDVYADAVFFPKLSRQTFMQEGWRLEYDEYGKPSIQGVVYNEMKGAYSNPIQVKFDSLLAAMYPSSYYKYDSGGDPINIPELTYEDFVAFHDKFYSPSNCLVVIMGDISTEEQLDHINETLTSRLINKYGTVKFHKKNVSKVPTDIKKMLEVKSVETETPVRIDCQGNVSDGESVSIAFETDLEDIKMDILDGLLFNESTSPFVKKIFENPEIGTGGCLNGKLGTGRNRNIYNLGFDNVEPKDEQKAFDKIKEIIESTLKEGFSEDDINSVIMKEQIQRRKKGRYSGGPISMSLAINVIDNWLNGIPMDSDVESIEDLEAIEKEIKANPSVIMDWYKQIFIDNKSVVKFIASPGTLFAEHREGVEQKTLEKLVKITNKETQEVLLKELHEYQEKVETEEELSCIPRSSISDLSKDLIQTVETNVTETVNFKNRKRIPTLVNKEPTLGVSKVEIMFPVDNLSPKDMKYVELITNLAIDMGTDKKSWEDVAYERSKCLYLNVGVDDYSTTSEKLKKNQLPNLGNRPWFTVIGNFLNRNTTESLSCMADFIKNTNFNDTERFKSILKNYVSSYKENLPNDNSSMMNYNTKDKNPNAAMEELRSGVTYSKFILGLDTDNTKALQKKLNKVFKFIMKSGSIFHVVTDTDLSQNLEFLAEDINAIPPKPQKMLDTKKILKAAYYPKDYDPTDVVTIKTDVMVGFAMLSYLTNDDWGSYSNNCRDLAFTHLYMHQLWEKVRTMNGAYGASAHNASNANFAYFSSYRDPNPKNSLKLFAESVKDLQKKGFSKNDLERAILSDFSDYTIPQTAYNRGEVGLRRTLRGLTNDLFLDLIDDKLNVNENDVENEVARTYASMTWNSPRKLVVVPKSDETTKNVIEL